MFAERGYVEVGIAEILQRSGVQAPTLYHHYGDKEGLFVAWAEAAFARLGEEIRVAANDAADPIDALTAFAERVGEYRGMHLLRTLEGVPRLARPDSVQRIERAYFVSVFEPLCILLMAAMDAGQLTVDALGKSAAAFLMGSLAVSTRYALPASGADSQYRWWVNHFVFGYVRPLP